VNVYAARVEKSGDSKDSFYGELEQALLSFTEVPYENSIRRF